MQYRPAHAGIFGGNGDDGAPVTTALDQRARPAADRILLGIVLAHRGGQHRASAQHQKAAQVGIAGLGDAPEPRLAAGTVLPRHQAQPRAERASAGEVVAIANRADQGNI